MTGIGWIAILITSYQEAYTSTTIACGLPHTPADDDLIHAIRQAHTLGLNVMLKTHLAGDYPHVSPTLGNGC